jgi:luciferase family oxidoreductase group 1
LKFSLLDSAPIPVGGSGAEALTESLARAGKLEELGCHRLWFTEHHLAPDVASSSPLTLVGQAAPLTQQLRLGTGGVMIRNHAPLVAAEQVTMLSLLYPDRIDLGLGRAGGSEPATDARIRRTIVGYDSFEDDVAETTACLGELGADGVQVFVLGSSRETAGLAARHGLGLAVAGHIAPDGIDGAVSAYRAGFRPRPGQHRGSVVLCLPVLIAGSDEEAQWWFRSVQRRYLDRLRTGGAPMRWPGDAELDWTTSERYRVETMLGGALVGSPGTVRPQLLDLAQRWAPDEIMAMTDLPDSAVSISSCAHLADLVTTVQPGSPGS